MGRLREEDVRPRGEGLQRLGKRGSHARLTAGVLGDGLVYDGHEGRDGGGGAEGSGGLDAIGAGLDTEDDHLDRSFVLSYSCAPLVRLFERCSALLGEGRSKHSGARGALATDYSANG